MPPDRIPSRVDPVHGLPWDGAFQDAPQNLLEFFWWRDSARRGTVFPVCQWIFPGAGGFTVGCRRHFHDRYTGVHR